MERISTSGREQARREPVRHVRIGADQAGRRIDNYLTAALDIPRSRIYQMLRKGEVRVDGRRVRQGHRLEEGEQVRIPPVSRGESRDPAPPRDYLLQRVRDSIIHEDEDILALNKPTGLVVHGGSGRTWGVIELLRKIHGEDGGGLQLVHRLDRETSGVLLIARHHQALARLQAGFRDRRVGKTYLTLLKGRLDRESFEVDKPLDRNLLRSGERLSSVSDEGKSALTRFRRRRIIKDATLAEVEISTGRTHQIRVHAAAIGHPVAGDDKYGERAFNRKIRQAGLKHLFLHAAAIRIPAWHNNKPLVIEAPLPAELADFLRRYEGSA